MQTYENIWQKKKEPGSGQIWLMPQFCFAFPGVNCIDKSIEYTPEDLNYEFVSQLTQD